ncbi:hypothetical protein ABIE27_000315 [Paenibacillus sp. 4624]
MATPSAISLDNTVPLGMRIAVYRRIHRSTSVVTQPLFFPRPDTTVSSSQCPYLYRVVTFRDKNI